MTNYIEGMFFDRGYPGLTQKWFE